MTDIDLMIQECLDEIQRLENVVRTDEYLRTVHEENLKILYETLDSLEGVKNNAIRK